MDINGTNKDSENTEKPDKHQYIKQPYPISTLNGDFTKRQTSMLVEVMETLSEKVDHIFEKNKNPRLLFDDEDFDDKGMRHIDIPVSLFTNRADEYSTVETVARQILSYQVKYEDDDGIHYMNAFTEIVMPRRNSRRIGILRFSLTKYQAEKLFNFTRYSRYLKPVVANSRSVYTARLYMLLSADRFRGECTKDYRELRRILGCDELNTKKNTWETKKYAEYKNFKMRVLKTAEMELKTLAEEGSVDWYFDFKENYEATSVNPTTIQFYFTTTELGKLEDRRSSSTAKYIELEHKLTTEFNFSIKDVKTLLKGLDEVKMTGFEKKIDELSLAIKKSKRKINDVRKYALKSLYTALSEITDDVQNIKEDNIVETKDESVVNPVKRLNNEDINLFNEISKKLDKAWLGCFSLNNVTDENIIILCPQESSYKFFLEQYGNGFFKEIEKAFGKTIQIIFNFK